MPNWKKVIVSGSDAALSSLNITGALTASGLLYPATDGTSGQVLQTDGVGNLSFVDGASENVTTTVKNVSGTALRKGTPVHAVSASSSGNVNPVIAASASVASTMPATFILGEDLDDQAEGEGIAVGAITGVNTSTFEVGDIVYVGVSGGYTNVKPTGSANLIQNLGVVTKVHASNGAGFIYGSGRSNDVPNLPKSKIWVGSDTYSVTSSVVHLDENNGRVGIGTDTPTYKFHVQDGTSYFVVDSATEFNTSVDEFNTLGSDALYLRNENSSVTYGQVGVHFRADSSGGASTGKFVLHNERSGEGSFAFFLRDGDHLTTMEEKMRITSDGNVGIGTSNPGQKLEVLSGSISISGPNVAGNSYRLNDTGGTSRNAMYVNSSNQLELGNVNYAGGVKLVGDVNVSGILTADEFHTTFVSASIVYQSGSTKFGDTADDNHNFTGSVNVNGRLNLASGNYITFYGNNNNAHGIASVDVNGNASDDLRINSYDNVYINLDSNSNSTNSSFIIGNHGGGSTMSNEVFRVREDGYVGIGVTSPHAKLTIDDSNTAGIAQFGIGDVSSYYLAMGHNSSGNTDGFIGTVYNNDAARFDIRMKGTAQSDAKVTVLGSGNVGIGTASPKSLLDVAGDVVIGNSTDDKLRLTGSLDLNTGGGTYYISGSSSTLRIGSLTTANKVQLELYHSANPVSLGIAYNGGQALPYIESVHPSYDTNTHLLFKPGGTENWRIGAHGSNHVYGSAFSIKPVSDTYDFYIAANDGTPILLSDTSTRRIGIGTTTPAQALTVEGNISASGDINASRATFSNTVETGNLTVNGDGLVNGDLTVTGIVTAQEFHTEFVSASIIYQSGSTQFGNSSDDVHQFSGSVGIWSNAALLSIQDYNSTGATAIAKVVFKDSGTYGDIGYVGFNGDGHFRVQQNVPSRYIVLDGANVGIGTTAPTDKLDVYSSSNNQRLIRISHPTSPTSASAFLGFNTDGTTDNVVVTLGVQYSNTYYDVLNIKRDTRYVGIGTTNPSAPLHVSGGVTIEQGTLTISDDLQKGGSGRARIKFKEDLTTDSMDIYYDGDYLTGDSNYIAISSSKAGVGAAFAVQYGGNVGIGTITPNAKLQVVGNVVATSFTGSFLGDLDGNAATATTAISASNALNIKVSDIDTAGTYYPMFADATSGFARANVDASTFTYNPSTDTLVVGIISGSVFSGSFYGDGSGLQDVTATVSLAQVLGIGNDAASNDIENVGVLSATGLNATGTIGVGPTPNTSLGTLVVSQSAGSQVAGFALHSDNGNAYMYMSGSSSRLAIQSGFAGGGSILLNPNSTGNVGINTSSPSYGLHVNTDAYVNDLAISSAGDLTFLGNALIQTNNNSFILNADSNANGAGFISLKASNVERVKITTSGAEVTGDLTVTGIVTAQEFHTEFVSASIIYQSGSTKFGDTEDDIHQFTGSLITSGSISAHNENGTSRIYVSETPGSTSVNALVMESNGASNNTNFYTTNTGNSMGISSKGANSDVVLSAYKNILLRTNNSGNLQGGSDRLFISQSGNVGIGTTGPQYPLDVAGGNIRVGVHTFGSGSAATTSSLAIGERALSSYTGTSGNTAVGWKALESITTQGPNDAFGAAALRYSTTATYNIGIGASAGYRSQGTQNTFIGQFSGPYYSDLSGGFNTFIGPLVGIFTSGSTRQNTGIGASALYNLRDADNNTAIGSAAGFELTFGEKNTFLGDNAGRGITTGNSNTVIGRVSGLSTTLSNTVIIGDGDGNKRVYINSAGNTGLGTETPTEKLHVSGTLAITDTATVKQTAKVAAGDPSGVTLESFDTATLFGAFIDYVVYDASKENMRAGTIQMVFNEGGGVQHTDNSTSDIGNTSGAYFDSTSTGAAARLWYYSDSTDWSVRYHIRYL